jgi:hypothetical protein
MKSRYLNQSNFSNPKAASFLTKFITTPTEDTLVDVLVVAADSTDFVESSIAANTLVAAEIVAASLGRPAAYFPIELIEIIPSALKGCKILAIDAVSVVMDSVEASVAAQAEANNFSIWEATQQDLLHRLA